jgi:hypothetical protein
MIEYGVAKEIRTRELGELALKADSKSAWDSEFADEWSAARYRPGRQAADRRCTSGVGMTNCGAADRRVHLTAAERCT